MKMACLGFNIFVACVLLGSTLGYYIPEEVDIYDIRTYYQKLDKKTDKLINTCNECKFIVSELEDILNDTAKLNRAQFILKESCLFLPSSQIKQCKNLVDKLYRLLIALGPYVKSPKDFCANLHLCNQSRISFLSQIALQSMKLFVRISNNSNLGDLLCDECIFAATELSSMLKDPSVQVNCSNCNPMIKYCLFFKKDIKKEMEQICHIFSSIEKQCTKYIEEYFPLALNVLLPLVNNPRHFCSLLKFCPRRRVTLSNEEDRAVQVKEMSTQVTNERQGHHDHHEHFDHQESNLSLKNRSALLMRSSKLIENEGLIDAACMLCKHGCRAMAKYMKRNKDIIASRFGTYICGLMPDQVIPECLDFTNIYAAAIVSMTVDAYMNFQLCVDLKLCSPENVLTHVNATEHEECEACRIVTSFVSYQLEQKEMQDRVTYMMKEFYCNSFPKDAIQECDHLTDEYIVNIMLSIANTLGNPEFCEEIAVCWQEQISYQSISSS